MKKPVLIAGSLNMDMVIGMSKMPAIGETVLANDVTYIPGGKGANQASAVARLGGKAVMLGSVGADDFGSMQKHNLTLAGVDVSRLKTGADPTGMASIYVDDAGNNSIVVVQGANLECDVSYIREKEQVLEQCDYVMLQMEIPYETIYYIINKAAVHGKTVILNPAPAPGPGVIPDDIYKKIDFITPNETELINLTGVQDCSAEGLEMGAKILLGKGIKNVLVTMGDKGVLLANEKGIQYFPAYRVNAVDTTAAGDCFNGAFVVALSEHKSIEDAICFANAAAAIAVSRSGAQSSIPSKEEVNDLCRELETKRPFKGGF